MYQVVNVSVVVNAGNGFVNVIEDVVIIVIRSVLDVAAVISIAAVCLCVC